MFMVKSSANGTICMGVVFAKSQALCAKKGESQISLAPKWALYYNKFKDEKGKPGEFLYRHKG